MSGELFPVPPSTDRLALARARFDAALAEYQPNGLRAVVPPEIKAEMDAARRELAAAERERYQP